MDAIFGNLPLLGLLLGGGAVAGFIAGLLGVGGGIVLVPLLLQLLIFMRVSQDLHMHIAVGTSLAIIIGTGARAALAQAQRGALEWSVLRVYAMPAVLGAFMGAWLARYISSDGLKFIFAFVLLIVAMRMWFFPHWGTQARKGFRLGIQRVWAGVIGLLSAWLGIGGGIFTVPLLRMAGHPIHRAVATSSGLGVCLAVAGGVGFVLAGWGHPALPAYSWGYVYVPGLLIAVTSIAFSPLGVRASHALAPRRLEVVFGIALVASAARILISAL